MHHRRPHFTAFAAAWPLVLAAVLAASAPAQTVTFDPLVVAADAHRVLPHDGWIYAGHGLGGLIAWNASAPQNQRHFTRREGLSGNDVTDVVWTGRNLWVATRDGGLTRLTDPSGAAPVTRVYASNVSSLAVTALAGGIIGDTERLYYGTEENGLGVINDGLPGAYFTTAEGLVDDQIISLAVVQDTLYVATPLGVSRFAENVFTTLAGAGGDVRRLASDGHGRALAATGDGLRRWDQHLGQWTAVTAAGQSLVDLAVTSEGIYLLRQDGVVLLYQDDVLSEVGTTPALPDAAVERQALAVAGDEVWLAGRYRPGDTQLAGTSAGFAWAAVRRGGAWTQWHRDGSVVSDGDGVAFDAQGRAWIGERNGDGLSGLSPQGDWLNITQIATAENDSTGLYNPFGGVLAIAGDAVGALWFTQFNSGLIRVKDGAYDLIYPGVAPIAGRTVVRLATHPDGPVFIMTDAGSPDSGVQVLIDPDRWHRNSAWVNPDVGGDTVFATLVERRDVIWFAVRGVGLVRWDVNGDLAGPNDPLTWANFADDDMQTYTSVPNASISVTAAEALALGPDGSIWVAANGVLAFNYDASRAVPFVNVREFRQKTGAAAEGLLSNAVVDVAFDRNGHLWALTSGGLNRIRLDASPARIDAFTDLASFLALASSGFYSANIIAALPGGTYRQLAVDATGERLVVSSDRGGARLTVAASGAGGGDELLASLYLYPNPFSGRDGDGRVRLGGLPGDDASATATVEIVNLQGQVVYRFSALNPDQGFFSGAATRTGARVATGLYVVKVTYRGATALRTLAVVD